MASAQSPTRQEQPESPPLALDVPASGPLPVKVATLVCCEVSPPVVVMAVPVELWLVVAEVTALPVPVPVPETLTTLVVWPVPVPEPVPVDRLVVLGVSVSV